ncbi:MAG TPA: NADH-quinone oxidoreductase subunit L [Candidatus Dormibacteraeota bacterium]|nr:NADH-quinone oxidoreductase subunit L [Candidatus Dormibacteraeota bacterium]
MPVVETALLRWIVFCPLIGTILCLFAAKTGRDALARLAGPLSVLAAFAVALVSIAQLWQLPPEGALLDRMYTWIHATPLTLEAAFRLDHLASVMILVVTGVGFLIHLYSLGYMHDDPDVARFFAYLNLFTTSMLILVLGDSLPMLFIGWEGVGLCSYLLIGFWYLDEANADAGRKAFIANRIGDAAFLVGIFLLFWSLGQVDTPSLSFADINRLAPKLAEWSPSVVTAICLLLFIGATGKSAQIPLFVWLPDAMAGPTPVSALIHAATMVTAGVYMIARLSPLYIFSPATMEVVAVIGAATAFFAATIGLVQRDLKKILAYSTISQLGYMFLALGCGAFSAAIFHLMTHAFFKACLFLGAGSVMHALHGEVDVFKMGGLKKAMPITSRTFLLAALAIAGFPGFAGFFSKDMILEAAFMSGHIWLWLAGVIAAGMTAFYCFRAYFLAFEGESRVDHDKAHHLHESPSTMTIPLVVLGALSLVGGLVGLPHGVAWGDRIGHYLEPSVAALAHAEQHPSTGMLVFLIAVASGVGLAGIGLAYVMYGGALDRANRLAATLAAPYRLLWNKYYIDELYEALFIQPYVRLSRYFWQTVDTEMIDGAVNGVGDLVRVVGGRARRLQTGNVQTYALVMLIGAVIVVAALVV